MIVVKSRCNNARGFKTQKYPDRKQAAQAVQKNPLSYAVAIDGREMSRIRFLHDEKPFLPNLPKETEWEDCLCQK